MLDHALHAHEARALDEDRPLSTVRPWVRAITASIETRCSPPAPNARAAVRASVPTEISRSTPASFA